MTDVKPSAAVEMTLLTKERPLVSEMKAWIEARRWPARRVEIAIAATAPVT